MNFSEKDVKNCKKIYSKLSEKKINKLLKKQDELNLSNNLRSTLQKIRQDTLYLLLNIKVSSELETRTKEIQHPKNSNNPRCLLLLKKNQKISRNDRCEATGKKYKHCCGSLSQVQ